MEAPMRAAVECRTLVGTSGYSYKEWKGSFYPTGLAAADMLRYYSERLPTVEINNTFYRMPKAAVLQTWRQQVPDHFTFVLKASQRITHMKRLKDASEEVSYFFRTAAALETRLGPVLFQMPPFLRKDLPRLKDFLSILPEGVRTAFEFRHASWFDDEVFEALRERNAALCMSEADEEPAQVAVTANWCYLRLRKAVYSEEELNAWADRVRAQGWRDAYVFFKHEDAGAGPKLAARFAELMLGRQGAAENRSW